MQGRSHLYIYDDFLTERKFERPLAELEGRLSTLDLQGPIARLSQLRNAKQLVTGMAREGVSTIIVVGDDATLDKVMWFLPDLGLTIGFLPLRAPFDTAKKLGVPVGILACDVLAARHIETFDLGKVNDQFFLTDVTFTRSLAKIGVLGQYTLRSMHGADITISNLSTNPRDGLFDVRICPQQEKRLSWWGRKQGQSETKLSLSSLSVSSSDSFQATVDRHRVDAKTFEFQVIKGAARFITGRRGLGNGPKG